MHCVPYNNQKCGEIKNNFQTYSYLNTYNFCSHECTTMKIINTLMSIFARHMKIEDGVCVCVCCSKSKVKVQQNFLVDLLTTKCIEYKSQQLQLVSFKTKYEPIFCCKNRQSDCLKTLKVAVFPEFFESPNCGSLKDTNVRLVTTTSCL